MKIQAVNRIGTSLVSDSIEFQTETKGKSILFLTTDVEPDGSELQIAPYDLEATNISAKSVTLTWQVRR